MNIATFNFDGAAVRTLRDDQGEPWFVASDVCAALGIGSASLAVNGNPTRGDGGIDIEDKGVATVNTLAGDQQVLTVNESGLYALIFKSRRPEAKAFKKWVTAEVLPSIRKTGSYGTPDPMVVLSDPAALRGLLLGYSEKVLALETTVAAQAPKVAALDRLSTADGSLCVMDSAKTLGVKPKALFAWLSAHQWIYKRPGNQAWLGYQMRIQTGLLEHKVKAVERPDGSEKITEQVRVTPKGLAKLAEVFAVEGIAA